MISALVQPFQLALFSGEADPPTPRSARLRFPMPRALGLLPFATVDVVRVVEFVLACAMYGTQLSELIGWNDKAAHPVSEIQLQLTAISFALPVVMRDRWPLAAWRVAIVMLPLSIWVIKEIGSPANGVSYTGPMALMYLLVLYAVALRCRRSITVAIWIISSLFLWIVDPNAAPLGAVIFAVAVLLGYNVRVRRSATAELVQEQQRGELAKAAQAVLEERTRIARELHDVVAHHMSVIAIQAEAVPLKAAGDAAQLEAGLAQIRGMSLEAINELRQVLGVLRDEDGRKETAPQPGLDRIDELADNARGAGLAVVIKRSGSMEGLPAAVGLSMYRIVQEALSNVMRHAPGAAVAVDLAVKDGVAQVRVANGLGAQAGEEARGAGHGLIGMRERAALLGGTLQAVPVEGGGFEVTARLPIAKESA